MDCPIHSLPLERLEITQGDLFLGYIFVCPRNEWGSLKSDDCSFCLDGDAEGNPIPEAYKQLDFFISP